ncbi:hypothetical protein E0Z10_g9578 [Xylaria hypoxylon]|uniref:Uncharacterized protein n=1 Tax=Xylaria hypoxylon TaxID=37992 RepID=A0A4Z0YGV5_9PEZI|nr:hypothetical protein E0Z10_g9578 [Xylaria hypoxylon]
MASSVTYLEAAPSRDDGFPLSQKPAKIQSSQSVVEKTTEIFTDSGYSSQTTTPKEKLHESAKDNPLPGGPLSLLFFKKKKVSIIDKPTGQPTIDCFRAIQPYFEKLLLEEIRTRQMPGTRHKPISTRLAMMGTSESDARPHIVVLCQPEHKRWVQNFVKKEIIVDICRPKDLGAPVFEVIVFGIAPRLRVSKPAIEIVANAKSILPATPMDTLCGIPICFRHSNGQRQNATFGGIIKVVTAGGGIELLGITAGHALRQWNQDADEDSFNVGSPQDIHLATSSLIENGGLLNSEVTQANDIDEEEDSDEELDYLFTSEAPDIMLDSGRKLWDFETPTVLGQLLGISKEECIAGHCYDWALFQPIIYRMNRVPVDPKAQLSICGESPGATGRRPILVLSSWKDCKEGWILPEPGRILLEGDEFIDSFMVTMNDGPGIRDGDSGSWVIDASRFEVYGQLVASDMFGSGYAIPMTDILSDIKSQLGAQAVELPNCIDILHATNMEDKACSAKSSNENSSNNARSGVSILMPLPSEEVFEEERMKLERRVADTLHFDDITSLTNNDSGYSSFMTSEHGIDPVPLKSVLDLAEPAVSGTSDILHKKHDSGYASLDTSPATSPRPPALASERPIDIRIKTSWEEQVPTAITDRSKYDTARKMKNAMSRLFGR